MPEDVEGYGISRSPEDVEAKDVEVNSFIPVYMIGGRSPENLLKEWRWCSSGRQMGKPCRPEANGYGARRRDSCAMERTKKKEVRTMTDREQAKRRRKCDGDDGDDDDTGNSGVGERAKE